MRQISTIIVTTIFLLTFTRSDGQTKISIKKQARQVIAQLKRHNDYPIDAKDTLVDLNNDSFKDILIEFYGLAGTGEKNRVTVYLYDNAKKRFVQSEPLNHLANPTFYIARKVVVGYYLGNGGGDATKLKWHGLRLDTLEYIDIDVITKNNSLTFKLISHDYVAKKTIQETLKRMSLPKEYNYGDYKPMIKNSR